MRKITVVCLAILTWLLFSIKGTRAASFEVTNQGNPVVITCAKGDLNCRLFSPVIFKNVSGRTIYEARVWTDNSVLEFTNNSGNYVKSLSVFSQTYEPGYGPNLGVRVIPPNTWGVGVHSEKLYIDGKVCNNAVNPPDCLYNGADEFVVNIRMTDPTPISTKLNGDANGDGRADLVDFSIWKIEYMATNGIPVTSFDYSGPKKADFNMDGKIDLSDFVIWKNNYINFVY